MKNQHMAEFINELKYGDIAKYGRRGDTMIAHINPNEAAMLKRMGGAGTINPITGLREYWGDISGSDADTWNDGGASTDGGADGGTDGLSDEDTSYQDALAAAEAAAAAEYAAEQNAMLAEAEANAEAAWSRGGPSFSLDGTYAYDRFGPYAGPQRSGIGLANDLYEKNRTAYNLAYTNYIKANPGNPEGFAGFLGSLGAKGVADFANAVNTGYRFGGPEGTLADIFERRTSAINKAAAKEREKAAKEQSESDDLFESGGPVEEPGFFGFIGDVLRGLNPLAELTPQEKGVLQSYENLGLNVRERSTMDNLIGLTANLAMPGPLSALKFIGEKATGASIIGLATDPATGLDYLVQANGDLQLASGQLGDLSPQDGGNESIIPKKREAVTEAPKEEEEEEEVKAAEKKEIKPSAYQEYLADLLYPNTSDSLTRNV